MVGRVSAGGICMRVRELSKIPWKGVETKDLREHKDFKKGGQAGSMGGCLKVGGGLEPPYELCITSFYLLIIVDYGIE